MKLPWNNTPKPRTETIIIGGLPVRITDDYKGQITLQVPPEPNPHDHGFVRNAIMNLLEEDYIFKVDMKTDHIHYDRKRVGQAMPEGSKPLLAAGQVFDAVRTLETPDWEHFRSQVDYRGRRLKQKESPRFTQEPEMTVRVGDADIAVHLHSEYMNRIVISQNIDALTVFRDVMNRVLRIPEVTDISTESGAPHFVIDYDKNMMGMGKEENDTGIDGNLSLHEIIPQVVAYINQRFPTPQAIADEARSLQGRGKAVAAHNAEMLEAKLYHTARQHTRAPALAIGTLIQEMLDDAHRVGQQPEWTEEKQERLHDLLARWLEREQAKDQKRGGRE